MSNQSPRAPSPGHREKRQSLPPFTNPLHFTARLKAWQKKAQSSPRKRSACPRCQEAVSNLSSVGFLQCQRGWHKVAQVLVLVWHIRGQVSLRGGLFCLAHRYAKAGGFIISVIQRGRCVASAFRGGRNSHCLRLNWTWALRLKDTLLTPLIHGNDQLCMTFI